MTTRYFFQCLVMWSLRASAALAFAAGLSVSAHSLWLGFTLARPSQTLDQISNVDHYEAYQGGNLGFFNLFDPHNEHRIPVPLLLHLVDATFFDFTNRFLLIVIYAAMALIAALLARLAIRSRDEMPSRSAARHTTLSSNSVTWPSA